MGMWQSLDSTKTGFNASTLSVDSPPTPSYTHGNFNDSTTTLDPKSPEFSSARTFTMENGGMEIETKHSWWRKIPVVPTFALLLAIGTVAACIVILFLSDQKDIETWPFAWYPVQPSVLLSVSITFTNMAVQFLFSEGVTVYWWNRALKGSTIGELHHTWNFGSSLWAIVKGWRHFNGVALAHILVMTVVVDGPLLQRASTIKTEAWIKNTTVSAQLSNASLPLGYTGIYSSRAPAVNLLTAEMNTIVQQYNARNSIALNYTGCEGVCEVEMVAPGWDIQCNTTQTAIYFNTTITGMTDVLDVDVGWNSLDPSLISLHVEVREANTSEYLTVKDCNLQYAQIRYPLRLTNGTVQTLFSKTPSAAGEKNITVKWETLWYETSGLGTFPSTIGGLQLIGENKYDATASLYFVGTNQLETTGELAIEYLDGSSISSNNYTWKDPTDDIISAYQELMFRVAISASNSTTLQQYNTTETFSHTIYVSHYLYLWISIGVITLATIAASWNVIGSMHPDRDYNMGPFEIAKAFNSPYFQGAGDDKKAMKQIMKRPIVYGKTFSWEMDDLPKK